MKKNFWSGRMKTILIAALVVAILAAVVLGLSSGASFFENVTGSILSPVRSAVAAIDRQFEQYYNYLFQYAKVGSRQCRAAEPGPLDGGGHPHRGGIAA